MPLHNRETKKTGRGGGGPENVAEVETPIARLFGIGTIAAPDGSPAFHSAPKRANKPSLKGVNHSLKIMTPVSKLLKSKLSKDVVTMLRSHSRGKNPTVKETKLYFVLVGGDNAAEGQTGHIKNTMRRLGNVGRFNNSQTVAKNVQGIAAAALLRHAGFKTVLHSRSTDLLAQLGQSLLLPRRHSNLKPPKAGYLSSNVFRAMHYC